VAGLISGFESSTVELHLSGYWLSGSAFSFA